MCPPEIENYHSFVGEDRSAWFDEIYEENENYDFLTYMAASFPPTMESIFYPNLEGSSNGLHMPPITGDSRMVQDSSDGQDSLLDELNTLGQNANAGPQVISDESIPPVLIAQNGPKTPAMHCGMKRQDTADNLEDGLYMLPQKFWKFPHHRGNSPPISSQSNHTESDQWLGNYPTTEVINMPRGRACLTGETLLPDSMLSGETLMPDALANTSQPLQNGIPCEDRCETSTKRKSQEKETHFEEKPTEIQNNHPVRQAIVETIEGNNIPNAITDHDVVDHPTHMRAQPSLGSISTQPSSSFPSIENVKLSFNNLIALSLEAFSNHEKETSMTEALTILKEKLWFSEEKEQILQLFLEFPMLVRNWREFYSDFQMYSQQFSAETEKIRDLVENSRKDEVCPKVGYQELENNEKELMRQLDEVQKQKAEIAEQRAEISKKTKDLISLAEEKEARLNKEECAMRIATALLNNVSAEWVNLQTFFI